MGFTGPALGGRGYLFAISSIIVFVLMSALLLRLDREIGKVEQAQFLLRLSELRSAVLLMEASLVAKDQMFRAEQYEGSNPFEWMRWEENASTAYLGEQALSTAEDVAGQWIFDPDLGVVAYMPRSRDWLQGPLAESEDWLQFRVVALRSNDKGQNRARGLRLEALQEVAWRETWGSAWSGPGSPGINIDEALAK